MYSLNLYLISPGSDSENTVTCLLKVCTGMYRYIRVRTTVEFSYRLIPCCTGTYWYVPVCTLLPDPVQGSPPDGHRDGPSWSLISIERASGLLNSCIVFANEDSFAQWICKKYLSSRRQSMMAVGKSWFGFRRFKKCWRSFASRAKKHLLDQNWQSLACKAQCSDHWAKNENLTYQSANDCNYKV